jgi:hypothetical protein
MGLGARSLGPGSPALSFGDGTNNKWGLPSVGMAAPCMSAASQGGWGRASGFRINLQPNSQFRPSAKLFEPPVGMKPAALAELRSSAGIERDHASLSVRHRRPKSH